MMDGLPVCRVEVGAECDTDLEEEESVRMYEKAPMMLEWYLIWQKQDLMSLAWATMLVSRYMMWRLYI